MLASLPSDKGESSSSVTPALAFDAAERADVNPVDLVRDNPEFLIDQLMRLPSEPGEWRVEGLVGRDQAILIRSGKRKSIGLKELIETNKERIAGWAMEAPTTSPSGGGPRRGVPTLGSAGGPHHLRARDLLPVRLPRPRLRAGQELADPAGVAGAIKYGDATVISDGRRPSRGAGSRRCSRSSSGWRPSDAIIASISAIARLQSSTTTSTKTRRLVPWTRDPADHIRSSYLSLLREYRRLRRAPQDPLIASVMAMTLTRNAIPIPSAARQARGYVGPAARRPRGLGCQRETLLPKDAAVAIGRGSAAA